MLVNGYEIRPPKTFKDEKQLHKAVVSLVRKVWTTNLISVSWAGEKLYGGTEAARRQMATAKAMGYSSGWPDLVILEGCRGYNALAIELKLNPGAVFLKNGGFTANEHARKQAERLEELNAAGNLAVFVEGWDQAVKILEWYFDEKHNPAITPVEFWINCPYTGRLDRACRVLRFDF